MSKIRLLIADDEAEIREALADLAAQEESMELVGTAPDADMAISLACAELPDVAIVDVRMPGGGGPRAVREIRSCSPRTKVIALSAYEDRTTVLEMIRAGAVGYIVKGAPIQEIIDTIHRAVEGFGALGAEVTAGVLHELAGRLEREGRDREDLRLQVERVRRVLSGEGLSMAFQPIVDLNTGRVVGAEALARFDAEPRRPDLWFAEAGEVGLRTDLELEAVRMAIASIELLPSGAYLSVNVSPETLITPAFAELAQTLPSERLVVEVTEHARVDDYETLTAALAEYRAAGGRLAVDDAGAGFASLRHILRLAPDLIKLDMELTREVNRDRPGRALALALIQFAAEIGARIVAEGIEAAEELQALRSFGVSFGQGYLLGRPGPPPLPREVSEVFSVA